MDKNKHPAEPEEQVEHDEAKPPAADVDLSWRLVEKLPRLGDNHCMNHQYRAGPGPGLERSCPQARKKAHGGDQQEHDKGGGESVLSKQTQQLIVECRPRTGRRVEAIARLAHALGGGAPALHRRDVGTQPALLAAANHAMGFGENSCQTLADSLKARLRASEILMVNKP